MKLSDIITPIITESAVNVFKRFGTKVRRYYRCTSGPKKGSYVANPSSCQTRKDPRRIRHGKMVARTKKTIRIRKTRESKRKAISKHIKHINKPLIKH